MKFTAPTAFQVIRPASLEFLLRYGGVSNDETVRRIEATGRPVSGHAKEIISSFAYEPEEKDVRVTAPRLSEWFSEPPTTDAIYAKAKSLGFVELHLSAGLRLAELYAEQPNGEWIRIGHKPVPVLAYGGSPSVLHADHDGHGRSLYGYSAQPGRTWRLGVRFAFGVPESQPLVMVTQVP